MDETEEPRYLRLGADGKVYYITRGEAETEEVLLRPRVLTDQDILLSERNDRVKRAEELKEQISEVHQAMRDDDIRPSQYEAEYNALWGQYWDAIESLREIDAEAVSEFRDKVATKVRELEVKLDAINSFDDFEQTLACYEKNFDLMMVLHKVV